MTYYILLDNDSIEDIWDENILGEESFGVFYPSVGFHMLQRIINQKPCDLAIDDRDFSGLAPKCEIISLPAIEPYLADISRELLLAIP